MPHPIQSAAATLTLIAATLPCVALPANAAGIAVPAVVAQSTPAPVMSPAPMMSPSPAPTLSPAPMMSPVPSSSRSPQASPTPMAVEPPENPLITKRVADTFNAWQRGRIDRKTYTPSAGGNYNDAFVAVVEPDLKAIGPLQSIRYRTASLLLGDVVYRYDVTGASGVVSVLYALDPNGKTDGVTFTPQIFRSSYLSS